MQLDLSFVEYKVYFIFCLVHRYARIILTLIISNYLNTFWLVWVKK